MGYVYAFRHGHEDQFKFGRTTNLERRRKSLQTGCPKPLTLFGFIETEDAKEGEEFILHRLAHKRLTGEFCAVTAEEAGEAITACRAYLNTSYRVRGRRTRRLPNSAPSRAARRCSLPAKKSWRSTDNSSASTLRKSLERL